MQTEKSLRILTIDPSIRKLGITIGVLTKYSRETRQFNKFYLEDITQINITCKQKDTKNYQARARIMTDEVMAHVLDHLRVVGNDIPMAAIVEEQKVFGSMKGEAATNSGSIQKLYFMSGDLLRELYTNRKLLNLNSLWVQDVNDWKGQAKNDIVSRRVKRFLRENSYRVVTMEQDAEASVGIFSKVRSRLYMFGDNVLIREYKNNKIVDKAKCIWTSTIPEIDVRINLKEYLK